MGEGGKETNLRIGFLTLPEVFFCFRLRYGPRGSVTTLFSEVFFLFVFLMEKQGLCSACCWKLLSCSCWLMGLLGVSGTLPSALRRGAAAAISRALKIRIPVFSQVQVVLVLKPNESIS